MIGLLELSWRTAGKKFMPQIYGRHPTLIAGHASSSPSPYSQGRRRASPFDKQTGSSRYSP